MNHNEEVPDNLKGLGDMLPADMLKMVNELLERVHQADTGHQGNTVFIYAPGSQYVEKQYIASPQPETHPKTHPDPPYVGREKGAGELPEVLATDEAMALWKKAQAAGYVDEHYQPLLSRTQAALLADAMAERLGIKEKWKVFEGLWQRRNMYRDYYDAMNQDQTFSFLDKLKQLFG